MSNRDHLIDSLHSILEELWNGSDEIAASELQRLITWRARAVKPFTPTYLTGTFPAPVSQAAQNLDFLASTETVLQNIEAALNIGDSNKATELVKKLLSSLSERQLV